MSKLLNIFFIVLVGVFSLKVNAKTIKLNPNETKLLTNSGLWTLNATCNIQGEQHTKGKIKISILKNKGMINGKNLSTGQTTLLNVKNNTSISVSAESGTQINLMNLGSEHLEAVCST